MIETHPNHNLKIGDKTTRNLQKKIFCLAFILEITPCVNGF